MKSFRYYLEILNEIKSIIEKMNYSLSMVIVEGRNDEKVLREFGLKIPVYRFRESGLPNFEFIDEIAKKFKGKYITILLDFDKKGNEMSNYLSRELESKGVKIDYYFRNILRELMIKEGIRHIEEIIAIKRKSEI
ncbi:MAG: hypothetical protein LM593_04255 [Candidatus Verstraetearchaeota archaeon]|jgi:5S rRNA maturation endonuclease (ribonuclease M5)|nr:hypothetical protein [Candidatus Verstraetearchaeota archaeon]